MGFRYVVVSDGSYYRRFGTGGWAYVALHAPSDGVVGRYSRKDAAEICRAAGFLRPADSLQAEAEAVMRGLLALPNQLPTLVICDVSRQQLAQYADIPGWATTTRVVVGWQSKLHHQCHKAARQAARSELY